MDSYNRGGRRPPKPGARALPLLPLSPGRGVGGANQSCLTAPLSDDTCQVKKVNAIEGGIRLASDWHEGGMAWHGMAWHGVAWHGIVYTRHIRKY